jgi:hypothetical protein
MLENNLPSDAALMPQLPEPPARLVEAVAEAEGRLAALRTKYEKITLYSAAQIAARDAEIEAAERSCYAAVITLAEWRRQSIMPILNREKAALPSLEAAVSAAELAYRTQRRRVTLIENQVDAQTNAFEHANRQLGWLDLTRANGRERQVSVSTVLAARA